MRYRYLPLALTIGCICSLVFFGFNPQHKIHFKRAPQLPERPNIIIILADDMGYSDIGCYGGEISTPNTDSLAANGLRFKQFYNAGRCCPSRASVLTGLYAHEAGVGEMSYTNSELPPYQGFLNQNSATIAEVLKQAGYFTAMAGKWHVGSKEGTWPLQRGFDRFYGALEGGFAMKLQKGKKVMNGNEVVYSPEDQLPAGWTATDAWTTYAEKYVDEASTQHKPFFLYFAQTAPHWPLQAPAADIKKYIGRYKNGWQSIREARFKRMKQMGLLDEKAILTPPEGVPLWDTLSTAEKLKQDSIMATYAAMVEGMDRSIGKLVSHLKQTHQYDNTVVIFLSDNGGCAEGSKTGRNRNSGAAIGSPESFVQCGEAWANAQNTPYKMYKHYIHEGGIRTPFIVSWPAGIKTKNRFINETGHVIDLMPTCIELASGKYPAELNGQPLTPLEGKSLVPAFFGKPVKRQFLFWEHEGNRGIRVGNWKLVAKAANMKVLDIDPSFWELYNLDTDPTEMHNLASAEQARAHQLAELWKQQALRMHVSPWPKKSASKEQ